MTGSPVFFIGYAGLVPGIHLERKIHLFCRVIAGNYQ